MEIKMDFTELLKPIRCNCGKTHVCGIESVLIKKGAIGALIELCAAYKNILVVADENTFAAAGEQVVKVLNGRCAGVVTAVAADGTRNEEKVRTLVFDGGSVLIPDEAAIERVKRELAGADLIVGVGSGVIQDLCKCVSHYEGIPYMIVATAPSMDGYASTGAAMILGGMKETVAAGLPRAIIADVDVLKNAPLDMIRAGYGDIVGKYSALSDWRLSQIVNGEYFCDYIYDATLREVEKTIATARGLLERDEASITALMEALVTVGIMMSFATSSRPASGSEHHLSHFFEIVGIVKGEKYFAHGIDVAYSAAVTAKLRESLVDKPFYTRRYRLPRAEYEAKIRSVYGSVADGCIALQDKVGNYALDRTSVYKEKEENIKKLFAEQPSCDEIISLLSLVGLNIDEFYSLYGEEKINNAILYAKDLKDRYTVLWLYYDMLGE